MSRLLAKFGFFKKSPTDNCAVGDNFQELIDRDHPSSDNYTIGYNPDGTVNQIVIYKNNTKGISDRRERISFGYADLNLITETIEYFNFNDGNTLEKTTTITYAYNAGGNVTGSSQVTT